MQGRGLSLCAFYLLTVFRGTVTEGCFLCLAAIRAALRLILQTLFTVEILFTFGEDEFLAAVFAGEVLVWHGYLLF